MLPDDFENVSQSIIATNLFSNNILADITTKNYWDVVNDYKPLMHTWYLGILMQFYIAFVALDYVIFKIKGTSINTYITVWLILSGVSFLSYLIDFPSSSKFYQLPFRIFEFGLGSVAFYLYHKNGKRENSTLLEILTVISFAGLLCNFLVPPKFIGKEYGLISTVIFSVVLVYGLPTLKNISNGKIIKAFGIIGAASFSLYVWHQIVFAITRYSFTSQLYNICAVCIVFGIIGVLTYLSYKYLEKIKTTKKFIIVVSCFFIIVNACAFWVYQRAGIFYDIPELEVRSKDIHKGMWAEYCDRGFRFDRDFSDTNNPHWLVIGNSYGRDFINIILESQVKDKVDVSYIASIEDSTKMNRIHQADIVFISTLGLNDNLVDDVKSKLSDHTRLIVVGEKNFGKPFTFRKVI